MEKRLSLLLTHLASVNIRRDLYAEAIALTERALAIDKKVYGPDSPQVARDLNNLAIFSLSSGKTGGDPAAERNYRQALAIARKNREQRPDALLMSLNNLAQYYLRVNRPTDAESLVNEALQVCGGNPEPGPGPTQCSSFHQLLALVYRKEGHPNAAEQMSYQVAAADATSNLPWWEKLRHLETLARQYEEDGTYDLAEANYRQALALIDANAKSNEMGVKPAEMNNLGRVLVNEGRDSEAEDLFKRSLKTQEEVIRNAPVPIPSWLNFAGLENLYRRQGRLAELEPLLQQGIAVQERASGSGSEPLAQTLLTLARVYQEEEKYAEAQPACERALKIEEAEYGADSPQLIVTIGTCAGIARRLGDTARADALGARAMALRQKEPPASQH